MFCPQCGAEVVSRTGMCTACGRPAAVSVEQPQHFQRPGIITLLAVLQFIGTAVWLLTGIAVFAAAILGAAPDREAILLLAVVLGGLGAAQLACGVGLWKLKPYGRVLQLVFAWVGLLGFPLGTLISIAILVYLFKPGIRALFSNRPRSEFTPTELAQIAEATQGSAVVTVLIIVCVVLGSVAMLGIVAAIAVPGLLRARMAANEASAIGSLRAINSAEAAYAATGGQGAYATSLAVLSGACPGAADGFISPDLSQDPTVWRGYVIAVGSAGAGAGPLDCNGKPTELDYYATAVPAAAGATGIRAFSTSAASTIFFENSGEPPARSDTLNGTATRIE